MSDVEAVTTWDDASATLAVIEEAISSVKALQDCYHDYKDRYRRVQEIYDELNTFQGILSEFNLVATPAQLPLSKLRYILQSCTELCSLYSQALIKSQHRTKDGKWKSPQGFTHLKLRAGFIYAVRNELEIWKLLLHIGLAGVYYKGMPLMNKVATQRYTSIVETISTIKAEQENLAELVAEETCEEELAFMRYEVEAFTKQKSLLQQWLLEERQSEIVMTMSKIRQELEELDQEVCEELAPESYGETSKDELTFMRSEIAVLTKQNEFLQQELSELETHHTSDPNDSGSGYQSNIPVPGVPTTFHNNVVTNGGYQYNGAMPSDAVMLRGFETFLAAQKLREEAKRATKREETKQTLRLAKEETKRIVAIEKSKQVAERIKQKMAIEETKRLSR